MRVFSEPASAKSVVERKLALSWVSRAAILMRALSRSIRSRFRFSPDAMSLSRRLRGVGNRLPVGDHFGRLQRATYGLVFLQKGCSTLLFALCSGPCMALKRPAAARSGLLDRGNCARRWRAAATISSVATGLQLIDDELGVIREVEFGLFNCFDDPGAKTRALAQPGRFAWTGGADRRGPGPT